MEENARAGCGYVKERVIKVIIVGLISVWAKFPLELYNA
jgi:hypothetical protein